MTKLQIDIDKLRTKSIFIATPMFGGSCVHGDMLVTTEDGPLPIRKIVKEKYNKKIASFNETTNSFEWQFPVNWISRRNGIKNNPSSKKQWVNLRIGRTKKRLILTEDHQVAYIDDPLKFDKISYVESSLMKDRFLVRNCSENKLFNKDQISVIIGILMGDGSISKSGLFKITHSKKQEGYIKFIKNILGGKLVEYSPRGFSKNNSFALNLPVNAQTKYLRELFYDSEGKRKVKDILKYIDDKSLAFWYMDDGYLLKNDNRQWKENPNAVLCTDSLSFEDCQSLCFLLKSKWNIEANVNKYKKYFRISISRESSPIFWKLISPYISDDMKYKFPNNFVFENPYTFQNKYLDFSAEKVLEIKSYNKMTSDLYDIEIENNHNFVCQDSVIHNCFGFYMKSVMDLYALCTKYGIKVNFFSIFNESLIARSRNYIADEFMRSDYSHILWIDADIEFRPVDALAMLQIMIDNEDKKIVGGIYPKKSISYEKLKTAVDKGLVDDNPFKLENYMGDFVFNPLATKFPEDGPVEVREIGTGFLMIDREVFEKWNSSFPEYLYKPDHARTKHFDGSNKIMAYFQDPIYEGRHLSEDYWFCLKSREIGYKIWACYWMPLNHIGMFRFIGNFGAVYSTGKSLTANLKEIEGLKKK